MDLNFSAFEKPSPELLGETIFTMLITILVCILNIMALSYSPIARRLPLVVGVPTFLILSLVLLQKLYGNFDLPDISMGSFSTGSVPDDELPDSSDSSDPKKGLAWLFMVALLTYVIGILGASVAFSFLFLRLEGGESLNRALGFGIIVAVTVYLIFGVLLNTQLYPGIILEAIAHRVL